MSRVGGAPRDDAALRQRVLVRLQHDIVPVRALRERLLRVRRRDGVRVEVRAGVEGLLGGGPRADLLPAFRPGARPPHRHLPHAADHGPRSPGRVHGRDARGVDGQPELARLVAAVAAGTRCRASVRRVVREGLDGVDHHPVVRARLDGAEDETGGPDGRGRPRHVVGQGEGDVGDAGHRCRVRRVEVKELRVCGRQHGGDEGAGEGEEGGVQAGHRSMCLGWLEWVLASSRGALAVVGRLDVVPACSAGSYTPDSRVLARVLAAEGCCAQRGTAAGCASFSNPLARTPPKPSRRQI
ncbi:hypothetical protein DFJ74DRAFT_716446 [Hyaloraphidium curvatum]|nr:hypothetical protein DFJ74DRAFT_716446 [Hyaloraphidium curvatum]